MIRQRNICIAGILREGAGPGLEALLASMNDKPGQADPHNELVAFGRLEQIHVARFVILDDPSLADREIAPTLPTIEPIRLAFMADFDGGRRAHRKGPIDDLRTIRRHDHIAGMQIAVAQPVPRPQALDQCEDAGGNVLGKIVGDLG